jgi:hypothetical protein
VNEKAAEKAGGRYHSGFLRAIANTRQPTNPPFSFP